MEDDFALLEYIRQCFTKADMTDQECFSRVAGATTDVTNNLKMAEMLKELMQSISPYSYERIRFIFEVILKTEPEDQVAKKGIAILDVLSNFTRTLPPHDDEIVSVLTRHTNLRNDDGSSRLEFFLKNFPAAATRLPYHEAVMNPWNVLVTELSEQTIFRLVPLALPLGIPGDKFYLVVVNNLLQTLVISIVVIILMVTNF